MLRELLTWREPLPPAAPTISNIRESCVNVTQIRRAANGPFRRSCADVEIAGIPRLDRLGLLRVARRGRRDVAEMQVANCANVTAPLSKTAKHLGTHPGDDVRERRRAFLDAAQPDVTLASARFAPSAFARCKLAALLASCRAQPDPRPGSTRVRRIIVRGLAGY